MKNLFEAARAAEVKQRIANLRPDSERQWGKMNPAQALAHCYLAMEMATATGGELSAASIDRTTAGADCEEVFNCERDTDAPQFDDRQERGGDR